MRSILLCVMLGSVAGVGWGDRWSAAYDVASALLRPFLPREIAIDRPMGCTTTRVSVASDGSQGNGRSFWPSISGDGRYVAFHSWAGNLVNGDTNGTSDVFVRDLQSGETRRVSISSEGAEAKLFPALCPSISADGRYVAFGSRAANLVPGDTNDSEDVFVHDRIEGRTARVSVASDGTEGNWSSYEPSISADGRFVAFSSLASNLVPDDTNGFEDVFVHDMLTGATSRVSVSSSGEEADGPSGLPTITADGRYVAFMSAAWNIVASDTNNMLDVFVHDRATKETTRVSVASDGTEANGHSGWPAISGDGRCVAFSSVASNLVSNDRNGVDDVYVHDRVTCTTVRVSVASNGAEGNNASYDASISADGRYVAFSSAASNLVPNDTNEAEDVFVHNRATGETIRVSIARDGSEANSQSTQPSISADGRYVAFVSYGTNLVAGDTNGACDVFVHERGAAETGYSIAGEVTLEDALSYAGVRVRAMQGSGVVKEATTSESGWFQIKNLPPGTYDIVPTAMDWRFSPAKLKVTVPPKATGLQFTGKAPFIVFDKRELSKPIQRGDRVTISGRLFRDPLRPLANRVLKVDDGLGLVCSEVKTDDQGRFTYDTQANVARAAQVAFRVAPAPRPGFEGSLKGEPRCWQAAYVNCVRRGMPYRTTCAAFRNLYVKNVGNAPLLVTATADQVQGAAANGTQVRNMLPPGETLMVLKSAPHRDHGAFKWTPYGGFVTAPGGVVEFSHTVDADGVISKTVSAGAEVLHFEAYGTNKGDIGVCWAPEVGIPVPVLEVSGEVAFCFGTDGPSVNVGGQAGVVTGGVTIRFEPGDSIMSSHTPADGQQGYTRQGRISINFNPAEHIKGGSACKHFHLYDANGLEVKGRCWGLAGQLEFLPDQRLRPNEKYTAYLAPGIERLNGTTVDWAEWFEFTTNSNPWVSRCNPKDGDVEVPQSAKVTLEFDGPVDLDRTQASFQLFDGAGKSVPGKFIWATGGNGFKALTFVPKQPLWHDSKHKIVVKPYPLAPAEPDGDKFTAKFTVGSGILATHYPDRNAKRVPRDAEIVINFWRKVWAGSTFEHFKLAPKGGQAVVGTPTLSGDNLQFRFRPMVPLKPDTKYQATLEAGVKLKDGGVTTEPYAWEFWTAPETSSGAHVVATAVPTARGVEIVATLTGEARVSVSIMNIAGRLVRQVVTDRPAPAGKTVFLWNGYDDRGLRVPAGMYLVCVEARSESGTVERALTTVRVDKR